MTRESDAGPPALAGGPTPHIPVLVRPAVEYLNVRDGGVYVDGTFGAGGYTRAILATPGARVIGIDRDHTAILRGAAMVEAYAGRLKLIENQFSALEDVLRDACVDAVDGVVLDVGVSSMQLDQAERGFSFRFDGPLDMRMGNSGPSAADVVAIATERDLADIIYLLGEERHSRGVARAIVRARTESRITTTRQLSDIVSRVVRTKPNEIHAATRTFQALRIFVNDELGELATALGAAERALKPGGRLVIVSFHSLEDRIVKTFMVERSRQQLGSRHRPVLDAPEPSFAALTKRPIVADETESAENPRARSAKLRAAERTTAAAQPLDIADLVPRVRAMADVMKGR